MVSAHWGNWRERKKEEAEGDTETAKSVAMVVMPAFLGIQNPKEKHTYTSILAHTLTHTQLLINASS